MAEINVLRVLQTSISLFIKFSFLAHSISPSIQNKSQIFWKHKGHFLERDISQGRWGGLLYFFLKLIGVTLFAGIRGIYR